MRGRMPFALLLIGMLVSGYLSPLIGGHAVQAGGITLHPLDLACAAALVLLAHRRQLAIPRPIRLLLAVVAMHTLWGLATHPAQQALNGARAWCWLCAALIVGASARPSVRLLIGGLVTVEGLAIYGIQKYGIQGATRLRYLDGEFLTYRALTEAGALLLLLLAVLLVFQEWPWPKLKAPLLIAAALLTVVIEQRTVWIVALVVAPFLFLRWLRNTHARNPQLGYTAVGLFLLALPIIAWAIARSHTLVGSAQNQDTLQWRFESWRSAIDLMHGKAWLIGHPAGQAPARYITGVITEVQPHNLYVEGIYRFGLLGVVALAAVAVAAWRRARTWHTWVGLAVVQAALVAGLTYGPSPVVGLAIGYVFFVAHAAPEGVVDRPPGQAAARARLA